MGLGYDGKLFILAFDHRGSLKERMFGIVGREPAAEERARLADVKLLVWEGFRAALAAGVPVAAAGVLVDEELGGPVARAASAAGVLLAMPVEKTGRDIFDFEFGEDFAAHIEAFNPAFAKALVRWNPADDPLVKREQGERLRRLGEWLHARGRRYLFELLVPAAERQLALVGGHHAAFDTRLRPSLMLEAIYEIQEAGIEPDVWKIEGIDSRDDCELVARLVRRDGREGVGVVVLGRGAERARVEHWVRTGAAAGYAGFAIGRTIWWDGVQGWKDGTLTRPQAVEAIAAAYRRFVDLYETAVRERAPAR
jgi:myo-inositol catabolism protein IolC